MKRRVRALLLVLMLTLSCSTVSLASGGTPSLDELTAGSSVTTTTEDYVEETKATKKESERSTTNRNFTDSLVDAVNLTSETTTSAEFSRTANYYGSMIFQYLSILVSVGTLVMIGIDLLFIMIPPVRGMLANGYLGNSGADAQGAQGGLGGAQGGMGIGMGMGMGGYGSRMGMGNPYGGRFGGGMNRMGGMNGMGQQAEMQNQPASGRMQWVSNSALNAVSGESASNRLALVEYLKDMSVTIILSGVILVLAGTGVLSTFGFALGNKAAELMRGFTQGLV